MQIGSTLLTEVQVGLLVRYVPSYVNGDIGHKDCINGKIKSFNDIYVFVSYTDGSTAATRPQDLVWI